MKTIKKKLNKTWSWLRITSVRLGRWWWKQDRHYGWWWRVANAAMAGLLLASVALPVWQSITATNSYRLSADTLKLVGSTDPTLAKQLNFDAATQTYQFNRDAIKDDATNPLAQMQAQVGTASGHGKDKSLYALDVPTDFTKGVTYHDINSQLSFSLVPEFKARDGKLVDGHLVFPLKDGNQGVYTLKNNGLKEDIVVEHPASDTMSFGYQLNLPKTLAAKVIPNGDGAIGIYSGDPTLFSNISYGSDRDRQAVEKAREKADKNYLVFGLPSPVIKDTRGHAVGNARFELNGTTLTVVASGLSDVLGAVTIDPSVVVTSSGDFQAGNNEDNIDFSTSGQINRAGITGGSIGSWTTNSDTGSVYQTASRMASVAYNGYFYVLGSDSAVKANQVYYAPLNSNGSLGAWAATTSMNLSLAYVNAVAYNGFMYAYAGYNLNTNAASGVVQYAPINSNGTVGTWTTSGNAMATAVCRSSYAVYEGYLYAIGGSTTPAANCGNTSTGLVQTVQYASLKGDGSVGSWATTTSISYAVGQCAGVSGVMSGGTVAYNGYLYSVTGTCDGGHNYNTGQYALINSDGTVGSWNTVNTPGGSGGSRFGMVAYNGYLYIAGMANNTAMYYAPLNANGSVGTWNPTTSLGSSRFGQGMAAYNGYLYLTGGSLAGASQNDTQYAKIDPAGTAGAYTTSGNTFTTNRNGGQTIAYNGYLYELGGYDSTNAPVNTTYMASLNTDGSIGTFSSTGATTPYAGVSYFGAVAYNGNMYVVGGCTSAYASCTTAGNDSAAVYEAPINSDGTIGAWAAQTAFTTGRYGLGVVIYNGFIYVMGGLNGSTFQADIQYHVLNASTGAISGAWTTSAKTISTARAYFGATVYGGNLYIAGGCSAGALTCSTTQNDIQYAALATSGDLNATLTTNGTSFTNARGMLGLTTSGGMLYIIGGQNNGTYYSDTQFAPINSNGSVGTWTASSASTLATARAGIGTTAYNGFIYVGGGSNGTSYYNNIQYAPINNGGSGAANATTWTTSSNTINGTRYGLSTVVYDGYMYVLGGLGGSGYLNDVQFAPMSSNGDVGPWHYTHNSTDDGTTFVAGFSTARWGAAAVAYNGYLYLVGGNNATSGYLGDTQSAPINSNGTVGTWSSANPLGSVRGFAAVASYNGYLYMIGGHGAASTIYGDVQYAQMSNGTLGTWQTGSSFNGARYFASGTAYNGYLYLTDGFAAGGYRNDVQYVSLNTDGSLNTWITTTASGTPRSIHATVAYDGYLYVFGGGNTSYLNDVQYAPINSNGSVGTWQSTSSFTTIRGYLGFAVNNGYLYIAGGANNSGPMQDVQYIALNSIPRVAHYSKLIDLSAAVNVTSITYNGTLSSDSVRYRGAGSNGIFGSLGTTGSVSGSGGCLGNLTSTRYVWLWITFDDASGTSTGGSFPDSAGSNANLTDVTVNYSPVHPPPNIRLRVGQTLQNGNLSALDTCQP